MSTLDDNSPVKRDAVSLTGAVSLIGGREEQQDRYLLHIQNGNVYCVLADGMGGHNGGKEAANIIQQCALQCIQAQDSQDAQALFQAILDMSWQRMQQVHEERGLFVYSTVVMACVHTDGSMTWAHVGDSRLYVLDQSGGIVFRTLDHSMTELAVRSGDLTEEEAKNSPDRSTLYRSVGGGKAPKAVFGQSKDFLSQGASLLLLCSDGFWEFAPIEKLPSIIQQGLPLQDALMQAAEIAVAKAGSDADNTTALACNLGVWNDFPRST